MSSIEFQRTSNSDRAVLARLKRKLAYQGLRIKKTRMGQWEFGDYYAVDQETGIVAYKHIDMEAWGKEQGVME